MDFMDISRKRITVRKFAQTLVEEEKIQKILEAGRWSPTAVNAQPQRILVPNNHLGGHRKPLSETCFYNKVPDGHG